AQAGRARRALRGVEELEPAPPLPRRAWPGLLELTEGLVQRGCRDARRVLGVERLDVVEQPAQAAAGQRGGRDRRRPRAEAAVQHPSGLLEIERRDVPLGEDDERRAARLARDVG